VTRTNYWAICALWLVGFLAFSLLGHSLAPVLEPDSGSYIHMTEIRQAGYPLILRLTGLQMVVVVQIFLSALAILYLAWEVSRCNVGKYAPFILILALSSNPFVHEYNYHVLTESIFISLLTIFIGAIVSFFRAPGGKTLVVAAIVAGITACIRPNGLVLLPVLGLALLLVRQRVRPGARWSLVLALVPALLLVAAERFYSASLHGPDSTSLAGRHFFAKAALLEGAALDPAAETDPVAARFATAIATDFAPIRALLRQTDDPNIRSVLTVSYETCLEYSCVTSLRRESGLTETEINRIALPLAMRRIAAAPGEYLALVWMHTRSLWVFYSYSHPRLLPTMTAFIASHRPLPFESEVSGLTADTAPSRLATVIRPGMIGLGFATLLLALLALPALVRNPPPLLGAAIVAAVAVHASQLMVACVGVGIPRYTIALWPAIIAACLFALLALSAFRARRLAAD